MVVYVMSKSANGRGHATVRTRHVDVCFPSRAEVCTPAELTLNSPAAVATPPLGARSSFNTRGAHSRFGGVAPPPLIPEAWMNSLVQYVATLKKVLYEDARANLSDAIKMSIPLELKHRVNKNSDLLTAGTLYGGHVAEPVSSHQSLNRTMSLRRVLSSSDYHDRALGAQYTHAQPEMESDEATGRFEAYVANSVFQQARGLVMREKDERGFIEIAAWGTRVRIADDYEEEDRSSIARSEAKAQGRIAAMEVGEYLSRRRREQDNARFSVIERAAGLLKSEKDALRDEVLLSARRQKEETTLHNDACAKVVRAMIADLPLQPNASSIDAEVARLVLRERSKPQSEYFPDLL